MQPAATSDYKTGCYNRDGSLDQINDSNVFMGMEHTSRNVKSKCMISGSSIFGARTYSKERFSTCMLYTRVVPEILGKVP